MSHVTILVVSRDVRLLYRGKYLIQLQKHQLDKCHVCISNWTCLKTLNKGTLLITIFLCCQEMNLISASPFLFKFDGQFEVLSDIREAKCRLCFMTLKILQCFCNVRHQLCVHVISEITISQISNLKISHTVTQHGRSTVPWAPYRHSWSYTVFSLSVIFVYLTIKYSFITRRK